MKRQDDSHFYTVTTSIVATDFVQNIAICYNSNNTEYVTGFGKRGLVHTIINI